MKNIAVFFGGSSVEHDISVITGVLTANSLDKEKYNPIPIYVHNDGVWYTGESLLDLDDYKNLNLNKLQRVTLVLGEKNLYTIIKNKKLKVKLDIAVAINCMHGERGEDGSLAGILAMCDLPLLSPSMLASSISMDKSITKIVMKGLKIKTLPSITVDSDYKINEIKKKFTYPVIVKPCKLGSSIGIITADNDVDLEKAILGGFRFGDRVVIEPALKDFCEINCAAYSDGEKIVVSECERPVSKSGFLSFSDKYVGGKRVFPADINKEISDKIKSITEKVYRTLLFSGVIRIDYFVKDKEIYLNEINSVPGSLAFYLFCDTLKEFSVLLEKMITETEKRCAKESTFNRKYSSGILFVGGSKGGKKRSFTR